MHIRTLNVNAIMCEHFICIRFSVYFKIDESLVLTSITDASQ